MGPSACSDLKGFVQTSVSEGAMLVQVMDSQYVRRSETLGPSIDQQFLDQLMAAETLDQSKAAVDALLAYVSENLLANIKEIKAIQNISYQGDWLETPSLEALEETSLYVIADWQRDWATVDFFSYTGLRDAVSCYQTLVDPEKTLGTAFFTGPSRPKVEEGRDAKLLEQVIDDEASTQASTSPGINPDTEEAIIYLAALGYDVLKAGAGVAKIKGGQLAGFDYYHGFDLILAIDAVLADPKRLKALQIGLAGPQAGYLSRVFVQQALAMKSICYSIAQMDPDGQALLQEYENGGDEVAIRRKLASAQGSVLGLGDASPETAASLSQVWTEFVAYVDGLSPSNGDETSWG